MKILEAYCVELGRVVDIYEAQKAYFSLPAESQLRFNFRCSDEACRASENPVVSGVNYTRLAEETEKFKQIHFRAPPGNEHSPHCEWMQGDTGAATLPVNGQADGEHANRPGRAKQTDVIDVFRPKASDTAVRGETSSAAGGAKPSSAASAESEDQKKQHKRTREGYTSTTHLERFINCWSQYEGEELKKLSVTINGQSLSYRQAVTLVKFVSPETNGNRIIYGGARLKFWPEAKPSRLYINLIDTCDKFEPHNDKRTLTIDLPIKRIQEYSGGKLLLKKIEQAQAPGHYLQVFAWGQIKPREQQAGFVLEIDSLDNLVVKAVARKPKAKQAPRAETDKE